MHKKCKEIYEGIRSLRIQGAEAIAKAGVEALAAELSAYQARSRIDFLLHARDVVLYLKSARPTEPALRNALRFVFTQLRKSRGDVASLKALVQREARRYFAHMREVKQRIAEIGSRLLRKGERVLIHCHSSTVIAILLKAASVGKAPIVWCTETRPLLQGLRSVKELSEAGIETTLIVDSAAAYVLGREGVDIVLVGADAITATGDLINKVGTSLIASAASLLGKRFYSATGLHKYDPITLWGESEPIELRPPEEVIEAEKISGAKAINPAFDFTPSRLITAYITEVGVLPPAALPSAAWRAGIMEELYEA